MMVMRLQTVMVVVTVTLVSAQDELDLVDSLVYGAASGLIVFPFFRAMKINAQLGVLCCFYLLNVQIPMRTGVP